MACKRPTKSILTQRYMHHPQRHTLVGFTLMELLVVLSIVGLLVGLLAPQLTNSWTHLQYRQEMRRFEQHIHLVSHRAYWRNQPASIQLSGSSLQVTFNTQAQQELIFEHLIFEPTTLFLNRLGALQQASQIRVRSKHQPNTWDQIELDFLPTYHSQPSVGAS